MQKRSIGVTVLAFGTVMLAIYSQQAAVALLLTGSAFAADGGIAAVLTIMNGAAFLALAGTAYAVGFGLWTRRAWARSCAVALYVIFVVANVMLSALASNFGSTIVPTIAVVAALVYLRRDDVRAELGGARPAAALPGSLVGEPTPTPEPAH